MRVFALSDIHVDYGVNANWVRNLSRYDFTDDILILAGDVSHRRSLLSWCLSEFAQRMRRVLFVPGNHDLWVLGEAPSKTSVQKFREVWQVVTESGASMEPLLEGGLYIAPLFGWYDYSFGEPSDELTQTWMDFRACRWPEAFGPSQAAEHFSQLNPRAVPRGAVRVITFSHFLPRLDLVPPYVPSRHRILDPVLGSTRLERELRLLEPGIHVYGHSHINRDVCLDGVNYVNNAFGYPREDRIAAKALKCIDEL